MTTPSRVSISFRTKILRSGLDSAAELSLSHFCDQRRTRYELARLTSRHERTISRRLFKAQRAGWMTIRRHVRWPKRTYQLRCPV